jgi:hypothetical protein
VVDEIKGGDDNATLRKIQDAEGLKSVLLYETGLWQGQDSRPGLEGAELRLKSMLEQGLSVYPQ